MDFTRNRYTEAKPGLQTVGPSDVEIGGPGRLRLIHTNDSKDVRGKHLDRHEQIGQGHIGTAAFAELFAHPATDGVPFILETPGSREADNPHITLLRSRAMM